MTRSLILALSVCYYARLQDRTQYEEQVCRAFQYPLSLPGGVRSFREEIQWYVDIAVYFLCTYVFEYHTFSGLLCWTSHVHSYSLYTTNGGDMYHRFMCWCL